MHPTQKKLEPRPHCAEYKSAWLLQRSLEQQAYSQRVKTQGKKGVSENENADLVPVNHDAGGSVENRPQVQANKETNQNRIEQLAKQTDSLRAGTLRHFIAVETE